MRVTLRYSVPTIDWTQHQLSDEVEIVPLNLHNRGNDAPGLENFPTWPAEQREQVRRAVANLEDSCRLVRRRLEQWDDALREADPRAVVPAE